MTDWQELKSLGVLPSNHDLAWTRDTADDQVAARLATLGLLTEFQANHILKNRTSHLLAGDYVILEPVGQGGMGQTFLAKLREGGEKRFVLKTVLGKADPRQEREARLLLSLRHSCIVPAIDYFTDNDSHLGGARSWLVMKWLRGPDLLGWSSEHGATGQHPALLRKVLCWIRQAARGLSAAHSAGIVHRDIKPANLILDESQCLQVADFGIARLMNTETSLEMTATGQLLGTADYLAPEQAKSAAEVDERADLYSLGATLFHLIEGHPPYSATDPIGMLLQHAEAPLPKITQVDVPYVRDWLQKLINALMAKDPADRPPNAAMVANQIRSLLSGRFRLSAMHRRRWIASIGGASAACVMTVSLWPNRSPLPSEARKPRAPKAQPAVGDREVSGAVATPVDRRRNTNWRLHTVFPSSVHGFESSPSGQLVAIADWNLLRIIDPLTGRTIQCFRLPGQLIKTFDWSYDSSQLVVVTNSRHAFLCDLDSGRMKNIQIKQSLSMEAVACHPNSKVTAFSGRGAKTVIYRHEDASYAVLAASPANSLAWSADGTRLAAAAGDSGLYVWNFDKEADNVKAELTVHQQYEFALNAVGWRPNSVDAVKSELTVFSSNHEFWRLTSSGAKVETEPFWSFDFNVKSMRWPDRNILSLDVVYGPRFFTRETVRFSGHDLQPAVHSESKEPPKSLTNITPSYGTLEYRSQLTRTRHWGWPVPQGCKLAWPDQIRGVTAVAWSRNGSQLSVCSPHGGMQLLGISGRRLPSPGYLPGYVWESHFINEESVALVDWRAAVRVMDLNTRVCRTVASKSHASFAGRSYEFALARSNKGIIGAGRHSGFPLLHFDLDAMTVRILEEMPSAAHSLCASTDGGSVYVGLRKNVTQISLDGGAMQSWRIRDGIDRTTIAKSRMVHPIVVAGRSPYQLLDGGRLKKLTNIHGQEAAANSDGGLLAVAGREHLSFVDVASGNEMYRIQCGYTKRLVWHPNRNLLAMILRDGVATVFDYSARQFTWTFLPLGPDKSLTFNAYGEVTDGNPDWLEECLVVRDPTREGRSDCMPAAEFYRGGLPWGA